MNAEEVVRLAKQYNENGRVGIRHDLGMKLVCLNYHFETGVVVSDNSQKGNANEGEIKCTNDNCEAQWYHNHCRYYDLAGLCETLLDSRDPEVTKCPECNWFFRPKCGACRDPTYRDRNKVELGWCRRMKPSEDVGFSFGDPAPEGEGIRF